MFGFIRHPMVPRQTRYPISSAFNAEIMVGTSRAALALDSFVIVACWQRFSEAFEESITWFRFWRSPSRALPSYLLHMHSEDPVASARPGWLPMIYAYETVWHPLSPRPREGPGTARRV